MKQSSRDDEDATAGLPSVTAAYARAERPSALGETFGQALWLGRETGHNEARLKNQSTGWLRPAAAKEVVNDRGGKREPDERADPDDF